MSEQYNTNLVCCDLQVFCRKFCQLKSGSHKQFEIYNLLLPWPILQGRRALVNRQQLSKWNPNIFVNKEPQILLLSGILGQPLLGGKYVTRRKEE